MRYLKMFKESKIDIRDFFLDLTDNGFIMTNELNSYTFRRRGDFDFDVILNTFNEIVDRLRVYNIVITKCKFSSNTSGRNIVISFEVVDKSIVDNNDKTFEIELRRGVLKLIPTSFFIFDNTEYYRSNNGRYILSPEDQTFTHLSISCISDDNKKYTISWIVEREQGHISSRSLDDHKHVGNSSLSSKCNGVNFKIDSDNLDRIIKLLPTLNRTNIRTPLPLTLVDKYRDKLINK